VDEEIEDWAGPIVVKRRAHDEGMMLLAQDKAGEITACERAQENETKFREAGNEADAALWHDVHQFLMTRAVSAENVPIVVVDDDRP